MGHMYPEKLSQVFIKRIYAKGKVTILEMIKWCQQNGVELSCAEGGYSDDGMLCMGFEYVIQWQLKGGCDGKNNYKGGIIEAIIENDDQKAMYEKWDKDCLEGEDEWKLFATIKWKFAKGGRKAYLDGQIKHLSYVCL